MSAILIIGKEISCKIKDELKEKTIRLISETGKHPSLAVILVGSDPASSVYVNNKAKACEYVGIKSLMYRLPEETTESSLLELVEKLNNDDNVSGILCQLPLPKHLKSTEKKIIEKISPIKDVDAFSPSNVGRIVTGDYNFLPCTPSGVMDMLEYHKIMLDGKNCVVLGRSNIVGKPMAMLMLHKNATVTICHSYTENLSDITRKADIIVAAIGKPKFLTADMIKENAVIIDVGINRMENGKLCGDVDFETVSEKASFITPVPGGVGPMTVAELMKNTLTSFEIQNNLI